MELKEQIIEVLCIISECEIVDKNPVNCSNTKCLELLSGAFSQIQSIYEQAGWRPIQAGEDGLTPNPYTRDDSEMEHIRYTAFEEGCEAQKALDDKQLEDKIKNYKEEYQIYLATELSKFKQEKRELSDIIDNEYRRTENNSGGIEMNLQCSNCGVIWEISVNANTGNISNYCPQCGGSRYPIEDTKQKIKEALSANNEKWREKIEEIKKDWTSLSVTELEDKYHFVYDGSFSLVSHFVTILLSQSEVLK
jgi:hypothetical protein